MLIGHNRKFGVKYLVMKVFVLIHTKFKFFGYSSKHRSVFTNNLNDHHFLSFRANVTFKG